MSGGRPQGARLARRAAVVATGVVLALLAFGLPAAVFVPGPGMVVFVVESFLRLWVIVGISVGLGGVTVAVMTLTVRGWRDGGARGGERFRSLALGGFDHLTDFVELVGVAPVVVFLAGAAVAPSLGEGVGGLVPGVCVAVMLAALFVSGAAIELAGQSGPAGKHRSGA